MNPQEIFAQWKRGKRQDRSVFARLLGRKERLATMRDAYWKLYEELREAGHNLMDLYIEGDRHFVVTSMEGKLYRVPFTEADGEVSKGEPEQVLMAFTPVADKEQARTAKSAVGTSIRIQRQANGTVRWYAVAAVSVLNRVGEIDSRELFDSFIERIEETGRYPYLTYYHMGETLRMGTADFAFREGNLYLMSGTFDLEGERAPLAQMAIAALERDALGTWGISIGFLVTQEPEVLDVAGVKIPVYTRGIQIELSMLLESDAASYLTGMALEMRAMSDKLKEKLLALTGGDEELAAQIAAQADATNRSIEEQGMITRDTEAPDDEDAEEADSEDDLDVEWDDELVDEVAEAVVEHTAFRALQAHIAELETSLTKALTLIGAQDKAIKALERTAKSKLDEAFDRITEVEREDEERLDELVQDKPRRRRVKLSRPSERYRTEEDEAADLEDQAERVLASFTE